jgi:hypothetical protein
MVEHFGIFSQIEIGKEAFIDELKEYFECHRFHAEEQAMIYPGGQ